jgi:hypothetical protein
MCDLEIMMMMIYNVLFSSVLSAGFDEWKGIRVVAGQTLDLASEESGLRKLQKPKRDFYWPMSKC